MKQSVINSVSELAELLTRMLIDGDETIIAIDGMCGSGKSTLAREISQLLGATHIELDNYLNKNLPGFVEHIEYDEVGQAVGNSSKQQKAIIVEGVCVLEILKRLEYKPDVLIYVKRLGQDGSWDDEIINFPPDQTAEEVIANLKRSTEMITEMIRVGVSPSNRETVLDEIIRYHYEYHPHEEADVVFERVQQDSITKEDDDLSPTHIRPPFSKDR